MAQNNTDLLSYTSGGQKSEMGLMGLKSSVGRAAFLLKVLGKNRFLALFQLLMAICIP